LETKKSEANLIKVEDDPIYVIPLGPPAVTTLEPTSESEDEDGMTFTGAWFTPVSPIDDPDNVGDYSSEAYCCPIISKSIDVESLVGDEGLMPAPLIVYETKPGIQQTKHVHQKNNYCANVQ
jgi:hypothetical protein